MTPWDRSDDIIGRSVGSYRIIARLGEGGMGVVYKAEHSKLHKIVALKFLRRESLTDQDCRQRFMNEARAAAALDHSAICPIFDYDDSEEHAYISMAYVEGRSLSERLSEGPLPVGDALLVAIQVAEGLQAAHAQGILHRDIKPSNIIVGQNGQAKIVDFGLARIRDGSQLTRTGMTVGTSRYMSPEQATGREVDARTDIWSLGVVLYEMLAGRAPFEGEYGEAVLYRVVHEPHSPLRTAAPESPLEIGWIVDRCLAKRPEDRYADAGALLADLRAARAPVVASPRALPSWILAGRGSLWTAGAVSLVLVAMIMTAVIIRDRTGERRNPFRDAIPMQVTSDEAWEGEPAISPDGSRIAYAKSVGGNVDIYMINARGGPPLRLTRHPAADHDPCWLPDGSAVLFTSDRDGAAGIWRVDQLGGEPQLILTQARDPAVSRDGTRLACSRVAEDGRYRIAVAPLRDAGEPQLLTGPADGPDHHRRPSWSPDGSRICYATGHDLWLLTLAGAQTRPLLQGGSADDHPVWSPDGRFVYFGSCRGGSVALWRVASSGGKPERLTLGAAGECHPSLSADGSRLAYATSTALSDEDIVIVDRLAGSAAGIAGEGHDSFQPTLSADGGSMAFVSNRQDGRNEVWLQTLTG